LAAAAASGGRSTDLSLIKGPTADNPLSIKDSQARSVGEIWSISQLTENIGCSLPSSPLLVLLLGMPCCLTLLRVSGSLRFYLLLHSYCGRVSHIGFHLCGRLNHFVCCRAYSPVSAYNFFPIWCATSIFDSDGASFLEVFSRSSLRKCCQTWTLGTFPCKLSPQSVK
jgi:hypothetical protein